MIFGYARCSKLEQNIDRQLDMFSEYGIDKENIFQEKMTGTKADRPVFSELKRILRKDDTLVVESLSRLSRSTKDLLDILQEFETKGVILVSLKEKIDMGTPTGKLLITVLSALSQFERDIIVQRTNEGLEAARARGRVGGRPKIDDKQIEKALKMYNSGAYTISEICDMTNIGK